MQLKNILQDYVDENNGGSLGESSFQNIEAPQTQSENPQTQSENPPFVSKKKNSSGSDDDP